VQGLAVDGGEATAGEDDVEGAQEEDEEELRRALLAISLSSRYARHVPSVFTEDA
jgi:hypothetical protein